MARLVGLAVFVASISLSACGGSGHGPSATSSGSSTSTADTTLSSSTASGQPAAGGTLTLANEANIANLDQLAPPTNNEALWAIQQISQPLVIVDAKGKVAPVVASSYSLSPDKLTWTFKLRPGIKFSDGTPVTPKDVKFTIDQTKKSDTWGFLLDTVKDVRATGADSVVIRTTKPTAALPAELALFANGIVPAGYGGKTEKAFGKAPVGTGPFMVKDFRPGASLTLVKNPHYWRSGHPYLDEVKLLGIPDPNSRIAQLEGNQLDVIESPPWSQLGALKQKPGLKATVSPLSRLDWFELNAAKPPFNDPTVRQAVSLAIDRSKIAQASLFGYGAPAGSFLAPSVPFASGKAPAANPDAARKLLSSSSYHGEPVTLLLNGVDAPSRTAAQIAQQQLGAIGMKVKLSTLDQSTVLNDIFSGHYQMGVSYLTSDIQDPAELASYFLQSRGFHTNVKTDGFKAKVDAAAGAFDPATRAKLYADLQRAVGATNGFVAYQYEPYVYAMQDKVQGFDVSPTGAQTLENVSVGG
jgi:peptide/nickel transport system substrate-binding protein